MNLFTPNRAENALSRHAGKLAQGSVASKSKALTDVKNILGQLQLKPTEKQGPTESMFWQTPVLPKDKCNAAAFGIYLDENEEEPEPGHNHELCLNALNFEKDGNILLSEEVIAFFGTWKNLTVPKASNDDVFANASELILTDEPSLYEVYVSSPFLEDFDCVPMPPTPIKSL